MALPCGAARPGSPGLVPLPLSEYRRSHSRERNSAPLTRGRVCWRYVNFIAEGYDGSNGVLNLLLGRIVFKRTPYLGTVTNISQELNKYSNEEKQFLL